MEQAKIYFDDNNTPRCHICNADLSQIQEDPDTGLQCPVCSYWDEVMRLINDNCCEDEWEVRSDGSYYTNLETGLQIEIPIAKGDRLRTVAEKSGRVQVLWDKVKSDGWYEDTRYVNSLVNAEEAAAFCRFLRGGQAG